MRKVKFPWKRAPEPIEALLLTKGIKIVHLPKKEAEG